MNAKPSRSFRVSITLAAVVLAALLMAYKFRVYLLNPWTRDGQVNAYVVQVAPRVDGPITELPIVDNQEIAKGDLLFRIDPSVYAADLAQARADLQEAQSRRADASDKADRAKRIHDTDPGAEAMQMLVQLQEAEKLAVAEVEAARAQVDAAQLNLDFTQVSASVDGYVTHLTLDLGTQAVANVPALALVNKNSFWVTAFFRETLMEQIRPGYKAVVRLMAYPDKPIVSEVESVGWGIATQDGQPGYDLLPRVRPSFEWIRLAQRIPVRIKLGDIPEGVQLRVGTTATVIVLGNP